MKSLSAMLAVISFLMVINVAWLHSAARLGLQADAPEWMKFVWGLSVPYFFVTAMFWQAKRECKTGAKCLTLRANFDILGQEILRIVKRLVVPYFLWCWLGAVWSIALHGVQLKGWEALRYLGLQPGWDPAYQPMWFLKALFVVLCVETILINAGCFLYRGLTRKFGQMTLSSPRGYADDKGHQPEVPVKLRRLVFPVYVLHSMFVSLANVFSSFSNISIPPIGLALVAVACSVVTTLFMRRFLPQISTVLFGGR